MGSQRGFQNANREKHSAERCVSFIATNKNEPGNVRKKQGGKICVKLGIARSICIENFVKKIGHQM